jgi:peptidoglycan/LPS O-acetylase OafA/YrhL
MSDFGEAERRNTAAGEDADRGRSSGLEYQPALDGMRALAVAAVVLFHGGVAFLVGGFLGVDAFFVLSGFLITSLLVVEWRNTGRIRLGTFWLRRARRLLPALLVMLVVTVVAYRDVLDPDELRLLRGDAFAALGYVANWRMIYRGGDYFAQTAGPSPLQHTWSLGIEEQFYWLWPLIVVGLFALVTRGRVMRRWSLALMCLALAALSTLDSALLYQPQDPNRVYFGTDSRVGELLVGCALAMVLAGTGARSAPAQTNPGVAPRGSPAARSSRAAWTGVLALAGAAGAVAMLVAASGGDGWLYRGGLSAFALAVAAVIGHVTLRPAGLLARMLGLAPLVWLGRISYGVYLWHWPLFGLLNHDRTGLAGGVLLATRVAVTLAVATASYWLVERPVRAGLPWRAAKTRAAVRAGRSRSARRARTVLLTGGLATAAFVTAVVVFEAATPPVAVPAAAPVIVLPTAPTGLTASATPGVSASTSADPMLRPGRKPGPVPRIAFYGDSVSWTLAKYLPRGPDIGLINRAIQGCGIARLPDLLQQGSGGTNYPGCTTWDATWKISVTNDDPDVAVILLDRWELMDRRIDGAYHHVGEPIYDAYLTSELDLALRIVTANGAHVALLTAPYTHRNEKPDGSLYPEDYPQRVDAWNRLLYAEQARNPKQVTIIDLNKRVCPNGVFTWTVGNGIQIRSDGLHFTPEGVQQWIAPWLLPKLAALGIGDSVSAE